MFDVSHVCIQVGGHVWLDKMKSNKNGYIVPLCQPCNKDPKLDKEGTSTKKDTVAVSRDATKFTY